MSPMIEGRPRSALIGSSSKINPSHTSGTNHADITMSGAAAPRVPAAISKYRVFFESFSDRDEFILLNRVALNNSAVSNSAGDIVANAQSNPFLRRVGYDWAFATISPALFETAELFNATLFRRMNSSRSLKLSKKTLYL